MSSSTNNNPPFWPSWRPAGRDNGAYAPNTTNESNRIEPVFRHSVSSQATAENNRSARDRRQMPEERVVTRPFNFSSFPDHHRAPTPLHIVWIDDVPPRSVANPRFPLPVLRQQPATTTPQPDSRSNQDEQTNILSKLKKETYNPLPKQMTRRLSSFYRDQNRSNIYNQRDDDGKRCAVCLEDFEAGEQVMVTPCDHMFHEECILPWVKSHGQCPVCRYVLSERIRQSSASNISNNNVLNVPPTELFTGELISIIRAMEEAFLWGSR